MLNMREIEAIVIGELSELSEESEQLKAYLGVIVPGAWERTIRTADSPDDLVPIHSMWQIGLWNISFIASPANGKYMEKYGFYRHPSLVIEDIQTTNFSHLPKRRLICSGISIDEVTKPNKESHHIRARYLTADKLMMKKIPKSQVYYQNVGK